MEKVAMTVSRLPDSTFWRGKRVLVTGHTGFKGAWLALWLVELGAIVTGISLPPQSQPNLFESLGLQEKITSLTCDIRDNAALQAAIHKADPQIVLHLAAQALVLSSYENPQETFEVNVIGTLNVLAALRSINSFRACVVVTSDKVYRNLGSGKAFTEDDELGGFDPYSASKAACEIAVASFRASYFATGGAIATARAGNVIGGGDWAANRIIPDAIRAWNKHEALIIRNPGSIRPWQHVLEPLAGYLMVAESLWQNRAYAKAYNLGPHNDDCVSVGQLISLAQEKYKKGKTQYPTQQSAPHEATVLTLNAELAAKEFNIKSRWRLQTTIAKTMDWYQRFDAGQKAIDLCLEDIAAYENSNVAV